MSFASVLSNLSSLFPKFSVVLTAFAISTAEGFNDEPELKVKNLTSSLATDLCLEKNILNFKHAVKALDN